MKKRLSKLVLATKPPATGRTEIFDSVLPGFGFRITAAGARSYFVMFRSYGRLVRKTIGRVDEISLTEARDVARKAIAGRGKRRRGDPAPPLIPTFAELAEGYVARRERDLRPRSHAELRRIVDRYLLPAIGTRPIDRLRRAELAAVVGRVNGRVMANRVGSAASTILQHAVASGILTDNPARAIPKAKERSRDRVLSNDELSLVSDAASTLAYPWRPFIWLLILTGQRRTSVATMRWGEVDLKTRTWTIPAEKMKTGIRHDVALSDAAIEELRLIPRRLSTDYVFTTDGRTAISGFSMAKRRIDAAAPIAAWSFHDLRRTLMSGLAELGVAPHVADLILAHRPFKGSAAVYNRYQYAAEQRAALEAWGERVVAGLPARRISG